MIEVSHLVKEFKIPVQKKGRFAAVRNLFSSEHTIKRAVDDITFSVDDGEIVGFIGKNGAGKSTTIKMLSGILQPTSGNVTVDGIKPFEQRMENAKQIGVVFGQKTQLWWDVPLIESYRLLKEIYKIEDGTYRKNLDRYIPMLDLEEVINKPVRQMSLGQRVKADICAALLHDPTMRCFVSFPDRWCHCGFFPVRLALSVIFCHSVAFMPFPCPSILEIMREWIC